VSRATSARAWPRGRGWSAAAAGRRTSTAATTSSRPSSPASTTGRRFAQEEIFGPVLSVIPADSEEHAIELANQTDFGLNASVFTNDIDRAYYAARRIRSGTVGHNGFRSDPRMGVGGFKQSGFGREGNRDGILPYLEPKSVILDRVPAGY